MASTKAEFVANADAPNVPALLSGCLATSTGNSTTEGSPPGSSTRPAAQARKSNRSRTSTFLNNTLLRPRGKSSSNAAADDWSRPVGGSEGLGSIYDSSMNSRERSQVLRSVTQLTKSSINDLTGAVAEAFSGNATPGLSQSLPFFSDSRANSSSQNHNPDAPPIYHRQDQLYGRRASEGSVAPQASPARQQAASPSVSSPRHSLQSRRTSYFGMGSTPSATPDSSCSASANPSPHLSPYQQQVQQPSKSQRRSSGQFSTAARQAFRSSRSFLGLPAGITEDDTEAVHTIASRSSDRHAIVTSSFVTSKSGHNASQPSNAPRLVKQSYDHASIDCCGSSQGNYDFAAKRASQSDADVASGGHPDGTASGDASRAPTKADTTDGLHTFVAAGPVPHTALAAEEVTLSTGSKTLARAEALLPSASEAGDSRPIGKANGISIFSQSEIVQSEQTNDAAGSAAVAPMPAPDAAMPAVLRPAPTSAAYVSADAAAAGAKVDNALRPRQQSFASPASSSADPAAALATLLAGVSDVEQQQQQQPPPLDRSTCSAASDSSPKSFPLLQRQSRSRQQQHLKDPSSDSRIVSPAYSTAPSTPLSSDLSSVLALDDTASPSSSSLRRPTTASVDPTHPSVSVPPTLSSASSVTNITTFTSPSTPNTIATAITTAATNSSQSTPKLTSESPPVLHSDSLLIRDNSTALPRPSILLNSTTSAPYISQHVSSLSTHPLSSRHPTKQASSADSSGATQSNFASSTAASRASPVDEICEALPLTPPSSAGQCRSPRASFSGTSALPFSTDGADTQRIRAGPPSPPASAARGSVSTNASRGGSSNDLARSSLSPLSPHSSLTPASAPPDSQSSPESAAPRRGSGRVSFDLRRISLFGGPPSASKMTSNSTRASFSGIGNGLPPNATDASKSHQTSAPTAGSASKFFSRISLPGGSRRGSATELPLSSPETKSRSRFASFGKLGRGGDGSATPKDGLRNTMQPWASASTDVLNVGAGQMQARNSLAFAREEASRPRKSLHLPRPNLVDLDPESVPRTTASTSAEVYALANRAQSPMNMSPTQPGKPMAASLQSGRRPSFNFLRRASAASTNSNTDNTNGERRGSFARTFMQKTSSRNSKSDAQPDSAKAVSTSPREAGGPVFRNGIFDSHAPAVSSSVAYPGLSSTVNWNAPSADRGFAARGSESAAEIAPNDVDPAAAAIPAYPGSAPVYGAPAQPRTLTDLTSGILSERRPSQGIDQEQDATEATDTVADNLDRRSGPSSISLGPSSSTDSNASRQRPGRSSDALSHLPRLNSMRSVSGASQIGTDGNVRTRSANASDTNVTAGETSDEEQELSEDEEDADMTGQTSDYHDLDETETEDETDYENSPVASRRVSAAHVTATGSLGGGVHRNRPMESLILPPAPTFIPNISAPLAHPSPSAIVPTSDTTQSNGNGGFGQTVGRDSWISFSASGFTPFETPTPSMGGNAFSVGYAGPTPRARQEVSESSYFAARPGTSNSNRATTVGTMSGDAPPPSPSIISRSRAPSSASMRTLRTPGASANNSGPVPNRSMPPPVVALPPLALNRQISTASKIGAADRSKSPAQAPSSSRPSTSGTLTPQQAPVGERYASREPSIDRSGFERPLSMQVQREEAQAMASPPKTVKPLIGSDGVAPSSTRPNFYHQKSKSLVDLLGPASRRAEIAMPSPTRPIINEPSVVEALRTPTTPRPPSDVPAYSKKDGLTPIMTGLTAPASIASPAMSLGRRRSMFEMRADPPVYSIVHNRPEGPQIILPREEEGREKLPGYYCGVHIEGYLPRKMEFSAPGIQAKDRSWKRQYFVLHGTSLRVYKNDLSVDRHAVSGAWGEMKGVHVHLEPMNEDGSNGSGSGIGLGAAAREAISHTPLGAHRHDGAKNKEATTQFDSKNGLIRNYTLQGAESGLAADYLKRRHVVRVRAEGEQFLLQTRSDRHVVDWIEALQASTNVATDLEKRAMPKFITLPRRRRRRRRNPDGTTTNPEEQEARDLAEAQRRSVADAGGRAGGATGAAEATPRGSTSQRPSVSLESELNPSAAFERMLREDQEEGGRQTAAVM